MTQDDTDAAAVARFLDAVPHPVRRADALRLDGIFRAVTGWLPRMWGPSIVGYGAYDYRYNSGRGGTSLATGFSPRAQHLVIYIMPGYADFDPILSRLGAWSAGKSCLYIKTLDRIDPDVLQELIAAGLDDLRRHWPVRQG